MAKFVAFMQVSTCCEWVMQQAIRALHVCL
jgi:hypothetical protein